MDHHKLGNDRLRIQAYALDLQELPTCEQRAEAVVKLRAIGDPEAVPVLQRAIVRKGARGEMRGKLLNACLIEDARAAIGFLNGLEKKKQ